MDPFDYDAACELASEMTAIEAAKFLRSQTGHGLWEAFQIAKKVAHEMPDSILAQDLRRNSPSPTQEP